MTADNKKMGKTEKGAVWLDPQRTSPYEYYQFWINTDDRDVKRFLALFTFLSMEEVEEYGGLKGADIRKAKEILAYEATKIVHGEEEAQKSRLTSRALFFKEEGEEGAVPTTYIPIERFIKGIPAFKLFEASTLCGSGSEARRLIEQGGAYINDKKVEKFDKLVCLDNVNEETGTVILRAGKKKFHRIKILDKKN
jgi:tyrosyl-tRNA synthetase